MRKIAAQYLFTAVDKPIKKGIVCLNDEGIITEVIDNQGFLNEEENLEFYNGILIPQFVNAHCHLELSYMKGNIPQKTGLPQFLNSVASLRERNIFTEKEKIEAAKNAEIQIRNEGIIALGDISNSTLTLEIKKSQNLFFHTFVEVYDLWKKPFLEVFENGIEILNEFQKNSLSASLSPHAAYSCSPNLLKKISQFSNHISLHLQESENENFMFQHFNGSFVKFLTEINSNFEFFEKKDTSANYIFPFFDKKTKILFVHNIFTSQNDVEKLKNHFESLFWVLCPNSNLYIEDKLPDVRMFRNLNQKICLGTDSLASNLQISILSELKTLSQHFPEISFAEMLSWATINGAEALNFHEKIGSIEKSKKSGILLIENFDFQKMKLTNESKLKIIA